MMIEPATLMAFVLVTSIASAIPGPQMIFVLTQTAWRGTRSGMAALAGLQIGNGCWYLIAALGLGTLATRAPLAFTLLTLAGATFLAWLGVQALRHAGKGEFPVEGAQPRLSRHALRDSLAVSLGNPKSLAYVLALLPAFVDPANPVAPQLAILAAIGISADFAIGTAYVAAGSALSRMMARPTVRRRLDQAVAAIFLMLAAAIVIEAYLNR